MEPQQPWTMESSWNAELIGPLEEQPWLDQVGDYAMELVKPLLEHPPPVIPYEPGSWGPPEADNLIAGDGTWHNPR